MMKRQSLVLFVGICAGLTAYIFAQTTYLCMCAASSACTSSSEGCCTGTYVPVSNQLWSGTCTDYCYCPISQGSQVTLTLPSAPTGSVIGYYYPLASEMQNTVAVTPNGPPANAILDATLQSNIQATVQISQVATSTTTTTVQRYCTSAQDATYTQAAYIFFSGTLPSTATTLAIGTAVASAASGCGSTSSTSSTSSSSTSSVGAIVGGVVGGIAAIGIAAGAYYYFFVVKKASLGGEKKEFGVEAKTVA